MSKLWDLTGLQNQGAREIRGSQSPIDDYAKDGDQGRSEFCVVFTMSLCAFELKQTLISLLFQAIRLWN